MQFLKINFKFLQQIDFIYYTGDFTDHFEWLSTKGGVQESIAYITNVVKRVFPNVPVAMVLGNHDIYPSNA